MSDDEVRELAARRYLAWASRDAEKVTGDDYERVVERLREADEEGRKDLVADLSDGELLWMAKVNEALPPRSDAAGRAEALEFHKLALYESVRRAYGSPRGGADDDVSPPSVA